MAPLNKRALHTLSIVCSFMILVIGLLKLQKSEFDLHPQHDSILKFSKSSFIKVVNPNEVALKPGTQTTCTVGSVAGQKIPICTYPASVDKVVSAEIHRGAYWEQGLVSTIISILNRLRAKSSATDRIVFIDIGANVGSYSLAVAQAGYQVIAVEANWLTLQHLATSIVIGNVTDRVTLLHNAITNQSGSIVSLGVLDDNRGVTWVLPPDHCRTHVNAEQCQPHKSVTTITLDDLLNVENITSANAETNSRWQVVMKVDAEGSETKIFHPDTATNFMNNVDVHAVQMEWQWFLLGRIDKQSTNQMVELFHRRNFTVHSAQNLGQEMPTENWMKWTADVLFLRKYAMRMWFDERSKRLYVADEERPDEDETWVSGQVKVYTGVEPMNRSC